MIREGLRNRFRKPVLEKSRRDFSNNRLDLENPQMKSSLSNKTLDQFNVNS